ncbi:MAG: right-handed parallel beta-helix repeat-containing protein [Acidobacteriota bacterium]
MARWSTRRSNNSSRCVSRKAAGWPIAIGCLLAVVQPDGAQSSPTSEIFSDGFEQGTVLGWASSVGAGPLVPAEICTPPITASDTSGATTVGTGVPGSCSEAALLAALAANNGAIRFDCGASPHTITLTSQLEIDFDLVLDGGGLVTLSGGGTTRIIDFRPPFEQPRTLTVQNLTFRDGSTADLPGTTTDNGGAAIYRGTFGTLNVIDSIFVDNVGPASGQDVAGGAIYSFGDTPTTIVGSVFQNNRCSSGGALGHLFAHLELVNSILDRNNATGTGGNPGNGGNGGAIYSDGNDQTQSVCGSILWRNTAGARGGGYMRVSNNGVGPMTFDRSTIHGNSGTLQAGGLYLQGLQATIVDSTISANTSASRGGMTVFTNPGAQTLTMTNVTLADNFATGNLGAGMAVDDAITGTLSHLTIVRNGNSGEFSFASAIAGGAGLTVERSLIVDNSKVFEFENTSCSVTHTGDGSIQWPEVNAGGQSELPCATGVTFQDVPIGPLQNNGGPTPTVVPIDTDIIESLAGCSGTDQRGVPRGPTCTPGAVEP